MNYYVDNLCMTVPILLSLMVGMFLFMMIPTLFPLMLLCIVGGIVIGTGLGAISNQVLKKTSLV